MELVFTTPEVAAICQVGEAAIRKCRDQGLIVAWTTPGKKLRYFSHEIRKFMEANGLAELLPRLDEAIRAKGAASGRLRPPRRKPPEQPQA